MANQHYPRQQPGGAPTQRDPSQQQDQQRTPRELPPAPRRDDPKQPDDPSNPTEGNPLQVEKTRDKFSGEQSR